MKMLKTLKKIKAYFQTVEVYYNKKIINYKLNENYKLNIYKSFEQIKDKKIQNYFQDFKQKKKRFDKKQYFITMTFAKRLLSSGWMFKGKNWYISEIDKEITLGNETVLFDFLTTVGERNKGNYSKLLSLITKRFKGHKLIIYTLQNNLYSKKGILNAGFALKKILRKI
tara:strand:- start:304 stop:810 length:507 start_codon:yes stop_codon:yes gene_type:complete